MKCRISCEFNALIWLRLRGVALRLKPSLVDSNLGSLVVCAILGGLGQRLCWSALPAKLLRSHAYLRIRIQVCILPSPIRIHDGRVGCLIAETS